MRMFPGLALVRSRARNPALPGCVQVDGAAQLRCLRAGPGGRHLAVGDDCGNLRVFDAASLALLRTHEAHDGMLLCLDYSAHGSAASGGGVLLASGGRDGLVHLYDAEVRRRRACMRRLGAPGTPTLAFGATNSHYVGSDTAAAAPACQPPTECCHPAPSTPAQRGYELIATFEDHRAAVTGVRFVRRGRGLVSCGADGAVAFRWVRRRRRAGVEIPCRAPAGPRVPRRVGMW